MKTGEGEGEGRGGGEEVDLEPVEEPSKSRRFWCWRIDLEAAGESGEAEQIEGFEEQASTDQEFSSIVVLPKVLRKRFYDGWQKREGCSAAVLLDRKILLVLLVLLL